MSVFCTFAAKSWKRKAFNLGCRGSAAFLLKSNTLQSLWGGVQTVFKNFSWSYQRNNKWSTWSWGFLPGCSRPSGNTCDRKTKQEKTAFLQMWSYEMMTLVENIWTKYYVKYAEVYFSTLCLFLWNLSKNHSMLNFLKLVGEVNKWRCIYCLGCVFEVMFMQKIFRDPGELLLNNTLMIPIRSDSLEVNSKEKRSSSFCTLLQRFYFFLFCGTVQFSNITVFT